MVGGWGGRGGISCSARIGEMGAGGVGSSICRYHGIEDKGGDGVDSSKGGGEDF